MKNKIGICQKITDAFKEEISREDKEHPTIKNLKKIAPYLALTGGIILLEKLEKNGN